MILIRRSISTVILLSVIFSIINAQDSKYQGALIYQFTKYIKWPASNNFKIGVLGDSPIIPVLEKIAGLKKVDTKSIVIKKCESVDDVQGCQIVFVTEPYYCKLPGIVNLAKENKILIVTSGSNLIASGAGINFIKKEGKVLFQISKPNINATGLDVPESLIRFGDSK